MGMFTAQFYLAVILDLLFGDPVWLPHPVCAIGWYNRKLETLTRNSFINPFRAGWVAMILSLDGVVMVVTGILCVSHYISNSAGIGVAVYLLYSSLACRSLIQHSRKVYDKLAKEKNIEKARLELAKIVGRDTQHLDANQIIKATVETVAENLVDGVTAPAFWAIVFSLLPSWFGLTSFSMAAVGAYLYKAVNTLDSMFGYKNERYIDFGKTSAKLDDLMNFIPARITGILIVPSAMILGLDWRNAWRIFRRDRLAHASPNSAHSEASFAGALGIQLGGPSSYFGKLLEKPTLGDPLHHPTAADISTSNTLLITSTLCCITFFLLLRLLILLGIE